MKLTYAFVIMIALSACQREQTSVAIHIAAPSFTISTLQLSVTLGASAAQTKSLPATQSGRVVVILPAVAEQVTVAVHAVDTTGAPHDETQAVRSVPHEQVDVTIDFAGATLSDGGADLLVPGDQGPPSDMPPPTLSLLAGALGGFGDADGKGTEARFNSPQGLAIVGSAIYVAEEYTSLIRKVGSDGTVSTVQLVDVNGPAKTYDGVGLAYDGGQYLYLSEFYGCDIQRITLAPNPTGTLTMTRVMGSSSNACGFVDGDATSGRLNQPTGLAFDSKGVLWMIDNGNDAIRTFDPKTSLLATIAGAPPTAGATSVAVDGSSASARFGAPGFFTIVGTKVYVTDGAALRVIDTSLAPTASTYVSTVVPATAAGFASLDGIAPGDSGSLLALDDGSEIVHRIVPGTMPPSFATVAGNGTFDGPIDGDGVLAGISQPRFLQADGAGLAWFTDGVTLRKLTIGAPWTITTVAGIAAHAGSSDTPPRFDGPAGLAWDSASNIVYIADSNSNRIRAFQLPSGPLTTLAGNGASGDHDDTGTAATFAAPESLLLDGSGHLFVGEVTSNFIRKITLASGKVETVAGASAKLGAPAGLAFDGDHTIYVSDRSGQCIRTLDSVAGTLAAFAGVCGDSGGSTNGPAASAQFFGPAGLALDRAHHILYVADSYNYRIRAIDLAGSGNPVTTLSGKGAGATDKTTLALATYAFPYGIAFDDATGVLYVADIDNSAVRKLDLAANLVTTYIGDGFQRTDVGPLPAAINTPLGLAPTPAGLLVTTQNENALLIAK